MKNSEWEIVVESEKRWKIRIYDGGRFLSDKDYTDYSYVQLEDLAKRSSDSDFRDWIYSILEVVKSRVRPEDRAPNVPISKRPERLNKNWTGD